MKSALRCAHINKALRHFFPILNRVPRFSRPVRESLPLSEIEGWGFCLAAKPLAAWGSPSASKLVLPPEPSALLHRTLRW
jgi:hypothetical protein